MILAYPQLWLFLPESPTRLRVETRLTGIIRVILKSWGLKLGPASARPEPCPGMPPFRKGVLSRPSCSSHPLEGEGHRKEPTLKSAQWWLRKHVQVLISRTCECRFIRQRWDGIRVQRCETPYYQVRPLQLHLSSHERVWLCEERRQRPEQCGHKPRATWSHQELQEIRKGFAGGMGTPSVSEFWPLKLRECIAIVLDPQVSPRTLTQS